MSDIEVVQSPVNKGALDSTVTAIGYLRRRGLDHVNCSLTLIEPQIALTSAHCFRLLGNKCETAADAARVAEVAFSPKGDDTDRHLYDVEEVAIAPGAFRPAPADCPGGTFGPFSCAGEKSDPEPGYDVALIKLAEAVPEDVARPIRVLTSAGDNRSAVHGVHADLEDPNGPALANLQLPAALVGGWGLSKDCEVRHRRVGLMEIAGDVKPYKWHRACFVPRGCDYEPIFSAETRCEEVSTDAPTYVTSPYAIPIDRFTLRRTSSLAPDNFDGPITNRGDSGGPLLLWLTLPGANSFDFFVAGTDSASNNYAECGSDPKDGYLASVFSVTFTASTGPWIERTIAGWLAPAFRRGCHRDFAGVLRCPPVRWPPRRPPFDR